MNRKSLLAAAIAAVVLTGCIHVDRAEGPQRITQRPTIGQELLDLDRSRHAGVLSDEEYERLRNRIIARERH